MSKKVVQTEMAPTAVGAYSQAISTGELVFASGQLPIDPASGTILGGSIEQHAYICLNNLRAIAEAAGGSLDNAIKTTIFLTDMNDFKAVNEVYATFFKTPYPARSTLQVAALPLGVRIEIEAVFHIPT